MSKIIPNSYQCPNFYCDELMHLLTGEEWKVLDYTVRRIFGFHKDRDNISLTQYCEGIKGRDGVQLDHGTGVSRPVVIEALSVLATCKVIIEIPEESNAKGKCYALQLDSDLVDIGWLESRRNRKHSAASERTAKGRKAALSLVNGIDQQAVNPIDQNRSMPLTKGGQSHRPSLVNAIDRKVVNGIDTHSIQEKTSRKPGKGAGISEDTLCKSIEEIFPGHADNWQAIDPLVTFALKLKATPQQVRAFPSWLKANHPRKALTPFAFKDLFAESIKPQVEISVQSSANYACARCQDRKIIASPNGGRPIECPNCSAQEAKNARRTA